MKHRVILTLLIGATALAIVPDQPRANAQVTLTYWGYQAGAASATRQPRTSTGGQFADIFGPATTSCGTTFSGKTANVGMGCVSSTWGPTPSLPLQYVLAYVSISGGAGGDITVFLNAQGKLPASVPVPLASTTNPVIAVNAYYYPTGSCSAGQSCTTAAVIDEYGEQQGALLDDTFVSIVVPSDPGLNASYTAQGNKYGEVDTTKYGVLINADQPTYVYPSTTPPTATAEIFDRWVIGSGGNLGANAKQLHVGMQTMNYSMALYHLPCPAGSTWSSTGTISQCTPPPSCPDGEVWNPVAKKCMPVKTPSPVCHWCAKGQTCTEVGFECNCLRCTPNGEPPQPAGNRPQ